MVDGRREGEGTSEGKADEEGTEEADALLRAVPVATG